MPLPGELADVDLASGIASLAEVANVGIVLPHCGLGALKVVEQGVQHVLHMNISNVPRTLTTKVRGTMKALAVLNLHGSHQRVEVGIPATDTDEVFAIMLQVLQHFHSLTLAVR